MANQTIEQYIESFPNSTFPKQEGEPTYQKIKTIHKLAAENAASVETTRGGGQHGYLAIVLDPNTYHALTGATFMAPTNPGPVPVLAGNTRSAAIAAQENAHKEHLREYKEFRAVNKAILQLTTSAFEPKYLRHLYNPYTGYNNTTPLQVFQHLFQTYGNITELELIENEQKMTTTWNQDEPIETVFYQIEECVEFAQHGNAPFTQTQILNAAYYIMAQAKIFKDECKNWKQSSAANKTWPNFKRAFFQAYKDWKEANKYNAEEYQDNHLSNYARQTAEALQTMLQVNNATVEEQAQQMNNLTIQNQELRTQLETVTANLTALQNTIQQLTSNQQQSNNSNTNRQNTNNNNNNSNRRNNYPNSNRRNIPNNYNRSNQNRPRIVAYCWTHGGQSDRFHTSQTCMYPAPGHIREATLQDTQGGNREFTNLRHR